jgi:S1-C subfamily serine protease
MKRFLRPFQLFDRYLCTAALLALLLTPRAIPVQAQQVAPLLESLHPLLVHENASAGYLGVDLADVDAAKAQALKLKELRGALITLIDHDAPAGQVGLKVNDVILSFNGQKIEGSEQLRRILRETPPGRKASIEISRDGNLQNLTMQLADRKAVEHDAWNKIGIEVDGIARPAPSMGMFSGGGDLPSSGPFSMPFFAGNLNVGALVEPLTSQMAAHLGVKGGVMVKQVSRKSEAAVAGLKAFDVVLKVGVDSIHTSADWDRALRSNQGKPVQVVVLRDKKQQTLTLQVDSKHRSALDLDHLFPWNKAHG